MNQLREAMIALLSGLATKNEDGSINWEGCRIFPLDIEKQTYMVEYADGSKEWWLNDQLHREDGPAAEYASGNKGWYLNDQLHREDGPACEYADGSKSWLLNNQLHREDGPACEHADGSKEWWLDGNQFTEDEWLVKVNKL